MRIEGAEHRELEERSVAGHRRLDGGERDRLGSGAKPALCSLRTVSSCSRCRFKFGHGSVPHLGRDGSAPIHDHLCEVGPRFIQLVEQGAIVRIGDPLPDAAYKSSSSRPARDPCAAAERAQPARRHPQRGAPGRDAAKSCDRCVRRCRGRTRSFCRSEPIARFRSSCLSTIARRAVRTRSLVRRRQWPRTSWRCCSAS